MPSLSYLLVWLFETDNAICGAVQTDQYHSTRKHKIINYNFDVEELFVIKYKPAMK